MKVKFLLSLLVAGTLAAGAQSQGYKDGIEYYKAGQYDNAKTILERTINDSSTDKSLAQYYLGQVALQKGDKATAKACFEKGIAANADCAYNYVGLGALDLLNGNATQAQDNFKKAQSLAKKDNELTVSIARSYYNADPVKYSKEITKYIDKARKDSKNQEASIYIFEGDRLFDQASYGDAAAQYEQAINFDNNSPEGYVKYANAYFNVNQNFAIQKLEELNQLQPNSALAQRELAEKYYEGNHWNKASDKYGEYIKNPNHFPEDKSRYSVLLYYGEKYQQSLDVANEYLSQDPSNFLMQRLRFLDQAALKDYTNAQQSAESFFKNNPNGRFTSNDYTTYAEVLTNLGQDSLAVVQYEIAAQRDPENANLLKELSAKYSDNKDYVKAAETYDAYLKLQENPSLNDYLGMTGRYLNAAATCKDDATQRVAMADRGLEYIDKVIERAEPQASLYQRKARLYIARNGNQPDQNAIDTYKKMFELLDQDPANANPSNPNNQLSLYKEGYTFAYLYYGNIAKDKDKASYYNEKMAHVTSLLENK
jgi:tetratricopeptide (TPR) repeat protein